MAKIFHDIIVIHNFLSMNFIFGKEHDIIQNLVNLFKCIYFLSKSFFWTLCVGGLQFKVDLVEMRQLGKIIIFLRHGIIMRGRPTSGAFLHGQGCTYFYRGADFYGCLIIK